MKLATLAALTALLVGRVLAAPPNDAHIPSGVPATSGLPFSSLSFDTTATGASSLTSPSTLMTSASTAVTPPGTTATASGTVSGSGTTATATTPTTTSSAVATTSGTPTTTATSGARRLRLNEGLGGSEAVVGVGLVLGAVAALV